MTSHDSGRPLRQEKKPAIHRGYTFSMQWVIYKIVFIASALSTLHLLNVVARRVALVRRYKGGLSAAIALLAFVWMAWFAVHVLKM